MIDYTYSPIIQTVTETKYVTKSFSPFIGVSYLINPWDEIKNPMVQLNGGLYIKEKYGFSGVYVRDFINGKNHYGGMISIKF